MSLRIVMVLYVILASSLFFRMRLWSFGEVVGKAEQQLRNACLQVVTPTMVPVTEQGKVAYSSSPGLDFGRLDTVPSPQGIKMLKLRAQCYYGK